MRFLKKSYLQRATEEEARGSYKDAAAFYAKAEDYEKVGEMHEVLGDLARTFPAKITAYEQAIRWYKSADRLEQIAAKLAQVMDADIRTDAVVSAAERQQLPQVAQYYALAKQWASAGKIYEELGMYDKATEMYIQGGDIARVEQIAARKGEHEQRVFTAQQWYEDGIECYKTGQRDTAYESLQQCVALDQSHADAQSLFDTLRKTLPNPGMCALQVPPNPGEYRLFGKQIVTIGRQEENDLVLLQHDVSRTHARLGFRNETLFLEDLRSSNGTRLNGLRIRHAVELHDRDVLSFGQTVQFDVRIRHSATGISGTLAAREPQTASKRYVIFLGEIFIGSERECDLPIPCAADALPTYLFKMKYVSPYWYLYKHPRLFNVRLNGNPAADYLVIMANDAVNFDGGSLLFH